MRTALALAVLFVALPMPAQGQESPVAVDVYAGYRNSGFLMTHTFRTLAGTPPITWELLSIEGPSLVNAPTLTSDGHFAWRSQGSPFGAYSFNASARNAYGSDIGTLSLRIVAGGAELTPPAPVDAYLGIRPRGAMIDHAFTIWSGSTPVTWSNLEIVSAPGPANNAPTLTSTGNFLWDTHGSPVGTYLFSVIATNVFGSDTGTLHLELIPEPATWLLLSIAGVASVSCRRTQRERRVPLLIC